MKLSRPLTRRGGKKEHRMSSKDESATVREEKSTTCSKVLEVNVADEVFHTSHVRVAESPQRAFGVTE